MLICAVAMILCGTRQVGAMQQQSAIHGYMVAVRPCPSTQLRCSPVTLLSPGDLWAAYEAAADADSVLTDVVTAASPAFTRPQGHSSQAAAGLLRSGQQLFASVPQF